MSRKKIKYIIVVPLTSGKLKIVGFTSSKEKAKQKARELAPCYVYELKYSVASPGIIFKR